MSVAALVLNHLWQSTVFLLLAALLTLSFRKARARTRYWIWLAASLKFLLPFSLIVLAGTQIHWRSEQVRVEHAWPAAMAQVTEPFPE
ncbi:MAG TPA: hypothetical protein VHZ55_33825 [Bryobacteraceae bacterium]|jgi:hypothetical protein|nr:hypothetical protein [Bryobacteraceae bacterium]